MSSGLPVRVRVVEVGPRDGLQNEPTVLPIGVRSSLIENLALAGVSYIECGSFVSPQRVPQMAGSEAVFQSIERQTGVTYAALVPNLKGLERAHACHVDEVSVFLSASEAFSQSNLGWTIEESLRRAAEVLNAARSEGTSVRGYVSCVLGCPFAGAVAVSQVVSLVERLYDLGCREVSLGDTIGTGTPTAVKRLIEHAASRIPVAKLAVHFHDTWGQALANVYAALQCGISVVDSSVAGLGGCPYAPGATGNVATEDVVYMLHGMEIETGIDLLKLTEAAGPVLRSLDRSPASKAAQALRASRASDKPLPA